MQPADDLSPTAPTMEPLLEQLDRLTAAIVARDGELRRLRAELESRESYIQELHSQLRRQAERLEQLEAIARRALPPGALRGCTGGA